MTPAAVRVCRPNAPHPETHAPIPRSRLPAAFLPLGWYLTRHLELELLGVFLTHIAYWLAALAGCCSRLRPAFRRWQAELTAGTPPPQSATTDP